MKKLLLLPLLILLLASCSSVASNVGVKDNLYNKGKEIIQFTAGNVHSEQMEYSKDQQNKVDNFQSKFKNVQQNDENYKYYKLVINVIKSYTNYGDSIKELQSKYKMNLH